MSGTVTNKDLYEAQEKVMAKISNLEDKIDNNFVRNEAFEPVRKVVYGLVGAILMSVAGALIALVVKAQ